jgi:nitrate reductase cytochrome c-type subunit
VTSLVFAGAACAGAACDEAALGSGEIEPPALAAAGVAASPANAEPAAEASPIVPAVVLAPAVEADLPRPHRARGARAVKENADCVSCHEEEAREWDRSRHRQAFTNRAFADAFAIEPAGFCADCHAPEADVRPVAGPGSRLGVGCVTCHVDNDGAVLAVARDGAAGDDAPHAIRRSPGFGTAAACSGCHEFRFPTARPGATDDGAFMQTTAREHARSPAAERSCASCHMPSKAGRRSHDFGVVRDPEWLRDSLTASASLTVSDTLEITLTQTAPGHAFPTGDLFRRLEVGAELRGPGGKVLLRRVRYLERHLEISMSRGTRELVDDDRVFFEPKVVELDLRAPDGSAAPSSVVWWVKLQRVAQTFDGRDPSAALIESEVPLHQGTLPWKPSQP